MAHSPEAVSEFVCADCQVTHAGTPKQIAPGEHEFDAPEACGACGGTDLVPTEEWVHYHE